ncbi:Protein NUCLEAR FUSION DEFTIVE 2 [Trifolium repens]|nr:Protein NUCLEAR FUSION DEFTIVE 2 [Trifolium repens]
MRFTLPSPSSSSQSFPRTLILTFSSALETLRKQLGYTFKSLNLLIRAMTYASFSQENNNAFSIMGALS